MDYIFGKYDGLRGLANDSATKLLLHMDGANDSTSITDSSPSNHTANITVNGVAKLKTAVKKFGSASCRMWDGSDTTDNHISIADSADWNFGTGLLTLDAWAYLETLASIGTIFHQHVDNNNEWRLRYDAGTGWEFHVEISGVQELRLIYSTTPTLNTWYHLAVVRGWGGNANDWALCLDGVAVDTDTQSFTMPDLAAELWVGGNSGATFNYSFRGYLDEVRVSKGAARWIQDFIPPVGTS